VAYPDLQRASKSDPSYQVDTEIPLLEIANNCVCKIVDAHLEAASKIQPIMLTLFEKILIFQEAISSHSCYSLTLSVMDNALIA
jgi:hypothetical protein